LPGRHNRRSLPVSAVYELHLCQDICCSQRADGRRRRVIIIRKGAAMTERTNEGRRGAADEPEHSGNGPDRTGEEPPRSRRGGTREQHIQAGRKGGARVRQLIDLGRKYEQEHGLSPDRGEGADRQPE
jgi:hypothetical protein